MGLGSSWPGACAKFRAAGGNRSGPRIGATHRNATKAGEEVITAAMTKIGGVGTTSDHELRFAFRSDVLERRIPVGRCFADG